MRKTAISLAGLAAASLIAVPATAASAASVSNPAAARPTPTIVLKHGAWADGSSWDGVVTRLQRDGYSVDVPPNPLRGVASDAAYLRSYLATIHGPIILVGHSYGGFVTTNAATGNTNVKALVYVDAYVPEKGDTITSINTRFPGSELAPAALDFVPSGAGVIDSYVRPSLFRSILGNDLPPATDAALAATQRPIAASTLADASGAPAWAHIPSWDLIGTEDHAIPVAAQEFMAARAHAHITTVKASHLSLISRPTAVERLIEQAARHVG